jgi:TonB family protein
MRDALRIITTVLGPISRSTIVLLLLTAMAPVPWLLAQNAAKKATQPGAPNPYAWEVKDVVDRMTDQHHIEGYLDQHPVPGTKEEIQTRATFDATGMHWLMGYFSGTTPAAGLKQNVPAGGGGGGLVVGGWGIAGAVAAMAGAVANASRPSGPWVDLQLRIDDQTAVRAISVSQYSNFATLTFASSHPLGDDPSRLLAHSARMDQAPSALEPAENRSAATLDAIVVAKRVLVALPREDGSQIYLEIKPQDPSFQSLVTKCYPGYASGGPPSNSGDAHVGATYTANQFASLLPGVLDKAAIAHGLGPHGYDREADYIIAAVKTCSQITPEMAASPGIWRRYGQEYQICESLDSARHMYVPGGEDISMASGKFTVSPYFTHPTRPDVWSRMYQLQGRQWGEGKGFYLSVGISSADVGYSNRDDIMLRDVHISGPVEQNRSSAESQSTPPPSGVSGNRPLAPSPVLPAAFTVQVEGSVQEAKLIKKTPPAYPPLAKAAQVQGVVHLQVTIRPNGSVQNLQSLGGPPQLVQSAMQAVRQWLYEPTLVNGSPVAVVTTVDVGFTLTP